jgi:hypothetical protein
MFIWISANIINAAMLTALHPTAKNCNFKPNNLILNNNQSISCFLTWGYYLDEHNIPTHLVEILDSTNIKYYYLNKAHH